MHFYLFFFCCLIAALASRSTIISRKSLTGTILDLLDWKTCLNIVLRLFGETETPKMFFYRILDAFFSPKFVWLIIERGSFLFLPRFAPIKGSKCQTKDHFSLAVVSNACRNFGTQRIVKNSKFSTWYKHVTIHSN